MGFDYRESGVRYVWKTGGEEGYSKLRMMLMLLSRPCLPEISFIF